MNTLKEIIKDHIHFRKQIWKLAKADIIKTYRGAALGWAWSIVKPLVTIAVFWFAFSIGVRKGKPIDGYPFILWLIAGYVPWFYMRDCLNSGVGCIRRYKYLVKRIKYPVDTIPTFMSISYLLVNLGLHVVMLGLYIFRGFMPDIYWLQLLFYIPIMFFFFTCWNLFSSMLGSLSKDFLSFVKSIAPALFWLSGIICNANRINIDWIRDMMLFNPVTLIVNGYRYSLVYHTWFWEVPVETRHLLGACVIMALLGIWAYGRLKKEIPDVL